MSLRSLRFARLERVLAAPPGRALGSAVRAAALALAAALAFVTVAPATASAALTFPELTGRVVDDAHILTPQAQAELNQKLAALEQANGDQLVVVTLSSLQGDDIADYGYQLGRKWGIGEKGKNNGALFIVAPNEKRVRIEVGYGLEPVLTDAMSSVIINREVLPRFRTGDFPGGVSAGVDAIVKQISDPRDIAEARARAAAYEVHRPRREVNPFSGVVIFIIVIFVLSRLFRRGGGGILFPLMLLSSFGGRGRDDDWGGGGFGGGGGGGGFSGGGGSFGGGGASGGW